MPRMRACLFLSLLLFACWPSQLRGQQSQIKTSPTLLRITRPAGYIFAGTVRAIAYESSKAPGQVPTVMITFQVDQAIRGTRTGSSLTVREWAGLWNTGERYHRGDHVVLFLYPVSKLGLTSPVGGSQGRFSIDKSGRVIVDREQAGMIRELEPRITLPEGRIRLRDFTRAVRRRLIEEE
jgi:hypothetical protein